MPNATVQNYREWYRGKTGENDPRTDDQITFQLGESLRARGDFSREEQDPWFREDYLRLANSRRGPPLEEFSRGFGSTVDSLQGTAQVALAIPSRALGLEDAAESLEDAALANMQEAGEGRPTVTRLEDIDSFGAGVAYLFGGAGQVAPSVLESGVAMGLGALAGTVATANPVGTVAGAVGGAVGKEGVKTALRSLLRGQVRKRYISELGEAAGEAAFRQLGKEGVESLVTREAAAYGGQIATALNSYGLSSGEIYTSLIEDPEMDRDEAMRTSLLFGAIAAAPDTVVPAWAVGRLFRGSSLVKAGEETDGARFLVRLAKSAGKTVPLEAGTEAFQELVNIAAERWSNERDSSPLTPVEKSRILNAGALGTIGGAMFAPAGAIGGASPQAKDPEADPMGSGLSDEEIAGDAPPASSPTPGSKKPSFKTLDFDPFRYDARPFGRDPERVQSPAPPSFEALDLPVFESLLLLNPAPKDRPLVTESEGRRISSLPDLDFDPFRYDARPFGLDPEKVLPPPAPEQIPEADPVESKTILAPTPSPAAVEIAAPQDDPTVGESLQVAEPTVEIPTVEIPSYSVARQPYTFRYKSNNGEVNRTVKASSFSAALREFELSFKAARRPFAVKLLEDPQAYALRAESPALPEGGAEVRRDGGELLLRDPSGARLTLSRDLSDGGIAVYDTKHADAVQVYPAAHIEALKEQASHEDVDEAIERADLFLLDKEGNQSRTRLAVALVNERTGQTFVRGLLRGEDGELKIQLFGYGKRGKTVKPSPSGKDPYSLREAIREGYRPTHILTPIREDGTPGAAGFIAHDFDGGADLAHFLNKTRYAQKKGRDATSDAVSFDAASENLVARESGEALTARRSPGPDYSGLYLRMSEPGEFVSALSAVRGTVFHKSGGRSAADLARRALETFPEIPSIKEKLLAAERLISDALAGSRDAGTFNVRIKAALSGGGALRLEQGQSSQAVLAGGAPQADAVSARSGGAGEDPRPSARRPLPGAYGRPKDGAVSAAALKLEGQVENAAKLADLIGDDIESMSDADAMQVIVNLAEAMGGDQWAEAAERFDSESMDAMSARAQAIDLFDKAAARDDVAGMRQAKAELEKARASVGDMLRRALESAGVDNPKAASESLSVLHESVYMEALRAYQKAALGPEHANGELAGEYYKQRMLALSGAAPWPGIWSRWLRMEDNSLGALAAGYRAPSGDPILRIENLYDPQTESFRDAPADGLSERALDIAAAQAASDPTAPKQPPLSNPALLTDAARQAVSNANAAILETAGLASGEAIPLPAVLRRLEEMPIDRKALRSVALLAEALSRSADAASTTIRALPWSEFRRLPGAGPWSGGLYWQGQIVINSEWVRPSTSQSLGSGTMTPGALAEQQASDFAMLGIHETMHVAMRRSLSLRAEVKAGRKSRLSTAESEAVAKLDDLEKIYLRVRQLSKEPKHSAGQRMYGLLRFEEFASEALSNWEFQQWLSELPASDKAQSSEGGLLSRIRTIFDEIKRWMAETFLKAEGTALGETMDAIGDLLDASVLLGESGLDAAENADAEALASSYAAQFAGTPIEGIEAQALWQAAGYRGAIEEAQRALDALPASAKAEREAIEKALVPLVRHVDRIGKLHGPDLASARIEDLSFSETLRDRAMRLKLKWISRLRESAAIRAGRVEKSVADAEAEIDEANETSDALRREKDDLGALNREALKTMRSLVKDLVADSHRGQRLGFKAGELAEAIAAVEGFDPHMPLPPDLLRYLKKSWSDGLDLGEALYQLGRLFRSMESRPIELPLPKPSKGTRTVYLNWDMPIRDLNQIILAELPSMGLEAQILGDRKTRFTLLAIGKANEQLMDALIRRSEPDAAKKRKLDEALRKLAEDGDISAGDLRGLIDGQNKRRDAFTRSLAASAKARLKTKSLEERIERGAPEARGLRALAEKLAEALAAPDLGSYSEWEPIQGAVYVTAKRGEDGTWTYGRKTLDLDLATQEMRADIRMDMDDLELWLEDHKDQAGTAFYEQLHRQRQRMFAPQVIRDYRTANTSAWGRMVESMRDKLKDAGGAGADIAQMLNRAVSWIRDDQNNSDASSLSNKWDKAYKDAKRAVGIDDVAMFDSIVYNTLLGIYEGEYGLAERTERNSERLANLAYAAVVRLHADPKRIAPDARLKLAKLAELAGENSALEMRLASKRGVFIEDSDVKVLDTATGEERDLIRSPVQQGRITVSRSFSKRAVALLRDEMPKAGWLNTNGAFDELVAAASDPDMTEEQRAVAMYPIIDRLFDGEILSDFLEDYVYKPTTGPFVGAAVEGLKARRPIPQSAVQSAWEKSQRTASDFLTELRDAAAPDTPLPEFLMTNMRNLRAMFDEARRYAEAMRPSSDPNAPAEVAPHRAIDARKNEQLPPRWFDYDKFDGHSVNRHLAINAATAAFGRGGRHLLAKIGQLEKQLEAKVQRLDALRREQKRKGLSPAAAEAAVKAKIGKSAYFDLKAAAEKLPDVKPLLKGIEGYYGSPGGPYNDIRFFTEMLGTNGFFVLNNRKSAMNQTLTLTDAVQVAGLGKIGREMLARSFIQAAKGAFGSVAEWVLGGAAHNIVQATEHEQALMRLNFRPSIQNSTLAEYMSEVGPNGRFEQPISGPFNMEIAGRFHPSKLMRQSVNLMQREVNIGKRIAADERQFAPMTALLAPFDWINRQVAAAVGTSTYRTAETLVAKALAHADAKLKGGVDVLADPRFRFGMKDLGLTEGKKAAFLFGDEEGLRFFQDMFSEYMGETFETLVRRARRRQQAGKDTIFSEQDVILIGQAGIDHIAGEGNVNTRPGWLLNTTAGRIGGFLMGWPIWKMNMINQMFKDKEAGRATVRSTLRAMGLMAAWMAPVGLAFSLMMDKYDEWIIGKRSNLRPIDGVWGVPLAGPLLNAMGLAGEQPFHKNALVALERLAKAGNAYGLGLDVANSMINFVDPEAGQRGFSLDSRILAMSQFQNVATSMVNFVAQGEIDYENVVRPLLFASGMNGVMQETQMWSNLLGADNAEARVARRIDAFNYLRGAARLTGLEIRAGGGHSLPTPVSVHVRRMQRAAYADDRQSFSDAYEAAVQAAMSRSGIDRAEAERSVASSWRSRHPYTSVLRTYPRSSEIADILSVLNERGRANLGETISMHEAYGLLIGAKPPTPSDQRASGGSKARGPLARLKALGL